MFFNQKTMEIRWVILLKLSVAWLMFPTLDFIYFGHREVNCILNHDLLLTPQQGYHWQHSKRIFYKDSKQQLPNEETSIVERPWEHTLKHGMFLTVFANSSNNLGMKFYENFQQSPYHRSESSQDIRFGDIVTLAQGRLEYLKDNRTYQFVEDSCNGVIIFKCSSTIHNSSSDQNVIAIWLVQKIRHRDKNHQFIYDIRFSIKPIRLPTQVNALETPNLFKRKVEKMYNSLDLSKEKTTSNSFEKPARFEDLNFRSYIQRLNDYPNSLHKLNHIHQIGNNSFGFERRQGYYPTTRYPLSNENPLNIGEYYKNRNTKPYLSHAHPTTNINHRQNNILPNLLNLMFGKSPTPDSILAHQMSKKPFRNSHFETTHLDENPATMPTPLLKRPSSLPMVTHHFHHYYYLPPPASSTMINKAENFEEKPIPAQLINMEQNYHSQPKPHSLSTGYSLTNVYPTTPALPYLQRPPVPSAAPSYHHPVHEENERQTFDKQAPPSYLSNQLPLYIYPVSVEETMLNHRINPPTSSVLPPFKESELDTGAIRYSDPDPLYHGTIKEREIYPNYNKASNNILDNAKSFANSYQNQFKESQLTESDWQGREKLSHKGAAGVGSKQNSFSSKETAYSLRRPNNSKNVISKTRLTDIFKSNNKSTTSEPEIHTVKAISQSFTTILPRKSTTIDKDTLPVTTTIETSLDKNIKNQVTPANSGKQIQTLINLRSRNKTNSTNHETLTTPTTSVSNRRSITTTTTTSSSILNNTLISPRVIRKLKTVRVVAGEEKDYDSSYGDGNKSDIQSSINEDSESTTTSQPLEKAVLRWKLKRKTSDMESVPKRNNIYNNNTTNVIVKTSPTRNRKSTLKPHDNGAIIKIPSKAILEKNSNYSMSKINVDASISKISSSNSSIEQFSGMRKSNKDITFHGTVTVATPTPSEKVYEVLTQKSISKSVSFKVGANGEQIILINNDTEPDNPTTTTI